MSEYIKKDDAIKALGERPLNWLNTHEEFQAEVDWDEHIAAIKAIPPADVVERSRHEEIVTAYINGLENIINELKEEQRWIPCSERLPEEGDCIIVQSADGRLGLMPSFRIRIWEIMAKYNEFVAWKPIEPYEEKNNE